MSLTVPTIIKRQVNWGDQAPYMHVNNSLFFRWMESSWATFLMESGTPELIQGNQLNLILVSINCQFKKQVNFPDTILITCELSDIQHAFIIFKHQVWSSREQALSSHGESKVVLYNRQVEKIKTIPLHLRELFGKHQISGSKNVQEFLKGNL